MKPEPRLDVELPIRVFGMGADKRPFSNQALARNISHHGAKLSGLETQLRPGDVVGVQFGDRKARCTVIWVVDAGPANKIAVGVNLVDGQPCPWEKEMQATSGVPEAPRQTAASSNNQRKFSRHRVPFPIEIRDKDAVGSFMNTRSADISGHGCYVETMMPLPVGKKLNITFWLGSEKINTTAEVRSSDGGVGMGIEFSGLDHSTQERLQQHIEGMAAESGLHKTPTK